MSDPDSCGAPDSPATATRPRSALGAVAKAWHLLSLDAPTVAVTWCLAFAKASRSANGIGPTLVFLGLATWLCYVGDRVLDARSARDADRLRLRHRFYGSLWRGRRFALVTSVTLASAVCVTTALTRLPWLLLGLYALLATAACVYFACVHVLGARAGSHLPKEPVVAIIFALGCALRTLDRSPSSSLVCYVVLFSVLCWLNCVAIERWEGNGTLPAEAHRSTVWAARHLSPLLFSGAAAAGALGLWDRAHVTSPMGACLMAAFLLLAVLEAKRAALSPEALRVLADAVLLTPIPWLLAVGCR